jgi:hypothetical protein
MKIAITGHTLGIGQGFYKFYKNQGYDVTGFSRQTGHDLNDSSIIKNLVTEIANNYDMFINNAYCNNAQLLLMKGLHLFWKDDPSKIHVVIGSRAADIPTPNAQYSQNKKNIDSASIDLQKTAAYKLLIVKPGRVNTPTLHKLMKTPKPMIEVENLVSVVDQVLFNDKLNVVSITIEPKN